jgi:hypothetical protein
MFLSFNHCKGRILFSQETVSTSIYDFLTIKSAKDLLSQLQRSIQAAEDLQDNGFTVSRPSPSRIGGK